MEIHFLDIMVYILLSIIFFAVTGEEEGARSGKLVGVVWFWLTVAYIVIFGIIDYNIIDLPTIIKLKISL